MAIQNRGQFAALYDNVDKVIESLIGKQLKEIETVYTKTFRKEESTRKFERIVTSVAYGDVPQKPEGEEYQFDVIQQGWTKDITPIEYGLGTEWTETAEEDDQYNELKKRTKFLTFSMRQVEEKAAAAVFNNGFSTQLTADAVALFSTAHLLKRGGTAKNTLSTDADLSIAALTQAFTDLATDTKVDSGQLMAPPTSFQLIVHPANEMNAHRIVKSTGLPGTADNDINPIKASRMLDVVVNPFLSDSDAWFLVASDKDRHGLVYLQRIGVTLAPVMVDARTGNKLIKLRARKAWDSVTWQNAFGNAGAA